jgi:hypothetical protein
VRDCAEQLVLALWHTTAALLWVSSLHWAGVHSAFTATKVHAPWPSHAASQPI